MSIKFQKKNKDKINRYNYFINEKKKRYYKFMILRYKNVIFCNDKSRDAIKLYINNLTKEMQKIPSIKINNYCILTGRDKGVYRDFKLSRHQVKQNFKFLTGLRNSSF